MTRQRLTHYGGPAALLGGVMYIVASAAVVLLYLVFAEETKDTFFGQHAFIHMIDAPTFALLAFGAIGVYLFQADRLGRVAKAGFILTAAGFGLSAVGGITIILIGLAVGDEATLGVLDVVTHPLAHLLYALGSLVFGLALLVKGNLPKLGAFLMAVGPVALLATFVIGLNEAVVITMIPALATGLGWILLGHGLRRKEGLSLSGVTRAEPAVR
jgi:hypothetical protein